jgi:TonB family protein
MRTGLWRIVAAVLFALVTISSSKLSAQDSPASSNESATPQPAAANTAPANSSSGVSAGEGATVVDAGQIKSVGGVVTAPVLIKQVEPKFSEEARKKQFNVICTVTLIVDKNGLPQNVRVLRGVGMGLDMNAVEAVRQYRFKPAMQNGKPVAVYLNVQVHFVTFDMNGQSPPINTIQP